MHYIVELEMERFEEEFEFGLNDKKSNNYLVVHDYKDEYSHNVISKAQYQLKKEVELFLKEKNTVKYKVYCDWCVHVIDKLLYKQIIS